MADFVWRYTYFLDSMDGNSLLGLYFMITAIIGEPLSHDYFRDLHIRALHSAPWREAACLDMTPRLRLSSKRRLRLRQRTQTATQTDTQTDT